MLPGDELVADYLARAGRAAAAALAPTDCALVVEEVGRRVRASVGAPPRWDLNGTKARLAGLGTAENLVLLVAADVAPHALPPPPVAPPAPPAAPPPGPTGSADPAGPARPENGDGDEPPPLVSSHPVVRDADGVAGPQVAARAIGPDDDFEEHHPDDAPAEPRDGRGAPGPRVVLRIDEPDMPDNPTLDLGPVRRPVLPAQARSRVYATAGAPPRRRRFGPLPLPRKLISLREPEGIELRVRPLTADESPGRETLMWLNRLGWEVVSLGVLGIGVFFAGYLAWLLAAVLITRSRYWEISDKVRILIGLPALGLGLAVLWAWLRSTQFQESNSSSTRLSEAGHSLAHSFAAFPQVFGVLGALYLGYALVRDHHTV